MLSYYTGLQIIKTDSMAEDILQDKDKLKQAALAYHAQDPQGKIAIAVTKPCASQLDLSLAYTPGVAEPVRKIARDPATATLYTNRNNLVAVISDGSAILGLGNLGPLAAKPVMEGKAVLFKKFADIDVFDIEISAASPEEFIKTVQNIAPGFGGINLEDIAAPHCFKIEQVLIETLDIPVFHDDQHGTAIIVAAGLLNALELQGKKINTAKIVCVGAGAAAIASMSLLKNLGADKDNILMIDRQGVLYSGRGRTNQYNAPFVRDTKARDLTEAMVGADVVIGLSAPNVITADMLKSMAAKPVVFALSNPDPEVHPDIVHASRDDVIMGTGRSDFPNQVNNVLGFPFIFRGALDARAKQINMQMKKAAVYGLQKLAKEAVPPEVIAAYGGKQLQFGKNYIIPKPMDPRLAEFVAGAVKQAAIVSGVANI